LHRASTSDFQNTCAACRRPWLPRNRAETCAGSGVTHRVERLSVEAEAERFGHAETAAMLAEQLYRSLEASGSHGDILPSNYRQVKCVCLCASRRGRRRQRVERRDSARLSLRTARALPNSPAVFASWAPTAERTRPAKSAANGFASGAECGANSLSSRT
jgi:hypothetical protein